MARVTIRGHRAIFAARTVETVTVGDVGTWEILCTSVTLCVKLHLRHKRTNGQESNLVHFSLKMWQLVEIILMIFLYLLVDPGFLRFPLKFVWSIAP